MSAEPEKSAAHKLAALFVDSQDREHTLDQQLALYRAVLDHCPVPMFLMNDTGQCIYTNQAHQALTGAEKEELLGDNYINFIHAGDRKQVAELWCRCVAGDIPEYEQDHRFVRADNTAVRVHCHVVHVDDHVFVGYCLPVQCRYCLDVFKTG